MIRRYPASAQNPAGSTTSTLADGDVVLPRELKTPPTADEIARRLASFCQENHIRRLEIFGSVARGDKAAGSDVDLIATFGRSPGLRFFGMADKLEEMLGVPVDLMTAESVDEMENPFRKASIQRDRRTIYAA